MGGKEKEGQGLVHLNGLTQGVGILSKKNVVWRKQQGAKSTDPAVFTGQ